MIFIGARQVVCVLFLLGAWSAVSAHAAPPVGKSAASAAPRNAGSCKPGMVYVPHGMLTLGDHPASEEKVALDAFCIDKTEVTTAAYDACVKSGACEFPACTNQRTAVYEACRADKSCKPDEGCNSGTAGREDHPVNNVNAAHALAYCTAQNLRLPTGEEWEYAARGSDGRNYSWGNDEARSGFCTSAITCKVGSFPKDTSPFGVLDLMGSVAEWTSERGDEELRYFIRGGVAKGFTSRGLAVWFLQPAQSRLDAYGPARIPGLGFRCAGDVLDRAAVAVDALALRKCIELSALGVQLGYREKPLTEEECRVSMTPQSERRSPTAVTPPATLPRCNSGMVGVSAGRVVTPRGDELEIPGFCIDKTEVTTSAYFACVKAGKCKAAGTSASGGGSCNAGIAGREGHPINCVTWAAASAYCRVQGRRLPSSVEWEYAALGADGRHSPWGDAPPSGKLCWSGDARAAGTGDLTATCAVNSFPAGLSPFGAADMEGNVAEWTMTADSENQSRGRVVRGSSCDVSTLPRNTAKYTIDDTLSNESVGFRCAGEALP